MAKIEDIFKDAEEGKLTLEQFQQAAKTQNAKFVDLSEGKYVSVSKHNDELAAKDTAIETLNTTIKQRDTDMETIKQKLAEAGSDAEKLSTLSTQLSTLQTQYDTDTKNYQAQLSRQAREFAVKEYAATKKFTSAAAKRDYINTMINSEDVKLTKKGALTGLEEFDTDYGNDNADAFIKEQTAENQPPGNPATPPAGNPLPQVFVQSTPGDVFKADTDNGFGFGFIPKKE